MHHDILNKLMYEIMTCIMYGMTVLVITYRNVDQILKHLSSITMYNKVSKFVRLIDDRRRCQEYRIVDTMTMCIIGPGRVNVFIT